MATEVDRLSVVWDADISRLEDKMNKVIKSSYGAARKVEEHWAKVEPGKALESVFSSARLATFEEGSARLRIFGGALEKLGAIGLVAAAGIAAVTVAAEEARKAAEFADSIEKGAKAAHLSTDAYQELRFALEETGGSADGVSTAMETFSATLGRAQERVPKAVQAFHALGFKQSDIDGFHSAEEALDAVIEKIGNLRNPAQRDAAIDQLGLRDMAPLINAGVERMRELRDEAQRIGIVMDANLIERGARANREFETMSQVISVQLKSAFIDLAPILADILKTIAGWAQGIADIVDNLRDIEGKSDRGLQRQLIQISKDRAALYADAAKAGLSPLDLNQVPVAEHDPMHHPVINQLLIRNQRLNEQQQEIEQEQADRAARRRPTAPTSGVGIIPRPAAAGPRDDTKERQASADEALYGATRDLAQARAALAIESTDKAKAEQEAIDAAFAKYGADIDKRIAEVEGDKGITDEARRRAIIAELQAAREQEGLAVAVRKERVATDLAASLQQDAFAATEERFRGQIDTLKAEQSIATTQDQRRDLALRLFDLEEELARLKFEEVLASAQATKAEKDRAQAALKVLRDTAGARRQGVVDQNLGPLDAYFKNMNDQVADWGTSIQKIGVTALEDFNSGLHDAIENGRSLGDVLHNVLKRIAADLLTLSIEKYLELPLARSLGLIDGGGGPFTNNPLHPSAGGGRGVGDVISSIFSLFTGPHANGGYIPPGMWGTVGENGPEPVFGGRTGLTVIPNGAMRAASLPSIARAAPAIYAPQFDLRGAVVTEDILRQINATQAYADRAARAAGAQAYSAALRDAPQRMSQYDLHGT